jgi:hypothetical protein
VDVHRLAEAVTEEDNKPLLHGMVKIQGHRVHYNTHQLAIEGWMVGGQ